MKKGISYPLFSVIMPAYNSGSFIALSIESVLSQSMTDFELIIVDDCSSDNTYAIASKYLYDDRVFVERLDSNSGAAHARNVGIVKARGRYIAFLDSDDTWYSDKLYVSLRTLQSENVCFVCSSYEIRNENKTTPRFLVVPPKKITLTQSQWFNPVGFLTLVYDTNVCGKVYLPDLKMRNDWGLVVELLRNGGEGVGISDSHAVLCLRNGSLTSDKIVAIKGTYIFSRFIFNFSVVRSLLLSFVQPMISLIRRKRINEI